MYGLTYVILFSVALANFTFLSIPSMNSSVSIIYKWLSADASSIEYHVLHHSHSHMSFYFAPYDTLTMYIAGQSLAKHSTHYLKYSIVVYRKNYFDSLLCGLHLDVFCHNRKARPNKQYESIRAVDIVVSRPRMAYDGTRIINIEDPQNEDSRKVTAYKIELLLLGPANISANMAPAQCASLTHIDSSNGWNLLHITTFHVWRKLVMSFITSKNSKDKQFKIFSTWTLFARSGMN